MTTKAAPHDDGFTLVEVIVSISLVSIVMLALGSMFVATAASTHRQGQTQTASRLVTEGVDRVRALPAGGLLTGRDQATTMTQWQSPTAGAAGYLSSMTPVWDPSAVPGSGVSAALPTTAATAVIDGVHYQRQWYVGSCYQGASTAAGVDCAGSTTPGAVAMYRVVVAVSWPQVSCPGGICSVVSAMLVSAVSTDPVFVAGQAATPPTVVSPGTLTGELAIPVSAPITVSGGAAPITVTAAGLPPGLTMLAGVVTGVPTAAGSYAVTVSATDAFKLSSTASFMWTIAAAPAFTAVGPQSATLGVPVTIRPSLTGGAPALTVTAAGLPAGLACDPTTAAITGSPAQAGSFAVTVTATDRYGVTATVAFPLTVAPSTNPAVSAPAPLMTSKVGAVVAVTATAVNLAAPVSWTSTGALPTGLTLRADGAITGTTAVAGSYTFVLTGHDATGKSAALSVRWAVA